MSVPRRKSACARRPLEIEISGIPPLTDHHQIAGELVVLGDPLQGHRHRTKLCVGEHPVNLGAGRLSLKLPTKECTTPILAHQLAMAIMLNLTVPLCGRT